jgi:hypothetical protein
MLESVQILAGALQREAPPHLVQLPSALQNHCIAITALVNGKSLLFSIELVCTDDRVDVTCEEETWEFPDGATRSPWMSMTGSGAYHLDAHGPDNWERDLLRMVRAHDRHRISALAVADHLAHLNFDVSTNIADRSVGPRCIVAWLYKKGGVHKSVGGAPQFYSGLTRDRFGGPMLPTIALGMDVRSVGQMMVSLHKPWFEANSKGQKASPPEEQKLREAFGRLPYLPDEKTSVNFCRHGKLATTRRSTEKTPQPTGADEPWCHHCRIHRPALEDVRRPVQPLRQTRALQHGQAG